MALLSFRVSPYARNIYLYGTATFSTIPGEYTDAVKLYAAAGAVNGSQYPTGFNGYSKEPIDNALAQGYITQQEYDATIAYITV